MTEITVRHHDGIATTAEPHFLDPLESPPPAGVDLLIIQKGGVLLKSKWQDGAGFLAWSPLPKLPAWLKERLYKVYIGSYKNDRSTSSPSSDPR